LSTFIIVLPRPPAPTLFPYTTLFRSGQHGIFYRFLQKEVLQLLQLVGVLRSQIVRQAEVRPRVVQFPFIVFERRAGFENDKWELDRKSTRLNSSHQIISYAVFCLKKK